MEGHGLMRFVVLSSIAALGLNLLFDYLFVFGKLGFPALGGVGCAWTTTSIYWLWGLACVVYTIKHPLLKNYDIFASWPSVDWSRWRAILSLGLPIALALLAEEGFFNVTALLVAPLGTNPLGAHQITIQVVALILMFGLGIGQATAIRVAHSIGKSQTNTMVEHIKASFVLIGSISLSVGCLVYLFRDSLPYLFTQDNKIAIISSTIMLLAPIYLVCDAVQIWAAQTLRGFEDTKVPMFIQITSYWLLGFPLGYSLAMTNFWGESYGVYGFWIGFFGGVMFGSCLLCYRLYKKSHKEVIV
jgi:MATE family, multidrug efflux pump